MFFLELCRKRLLHYLLSFGAGARPDSGLVQLKAIEVGVKPSQYHPQSHWSWAQVSSLAGSPGSAESSPVPSWCNADTGVFSSVQPWCGFPNHHPPVRLCAWGAPSQLTWGQPALCRHSVVRQSQILDFWPFSSGQGRCGVGRRRRRRAAMSAPAGVPPPPRPGRRCQ